MDAVLKTGAPPTRSRYRGLGAAALIAVALDGTTAVAADVPVARPPAAEDARDWKFQLTLYGWATALNGDIGVRNLPTTRVDASFFDVLENLDGAAMGSAMANNGEWLFLADVVFAKLSAARSSGAFGGSRVSADLTQTIVTGAVGHMLPTGRSDFDFAITGGVRYMSMDGSMSFKAGALPAKLSRSQRQWWVDPTIGFYARRQLDEMWFVSAIADIGGFGVGSKLSSTGYLGVGRMWNESVSTSLGYRYLYEDYEGPGAKTGRFRYNTTMHGPTLALAWHF